MQALRDGRKVWVMGEGWAEDVTTHPATRAMVEEYAAWYDRHFDPDWRDLLLAPADAAGKRIPWAYVLPRRVEDLVGMGRSFAKTTFLSAGNITHTPAYGNLIAMGVLTAAQTRNAPERSDRRGHCLSRADRPHRAVPHLLRRGPDHRPAHAPGPARPRRAEARAGERSRRCLAR